MRRLGVNVDHVATLRQARGGTDPDPLAAAVLVELAGADGLVVHLREDRRHIQDRDLRLLRELTRTKLDLEMAADDEMVKIARTIFVLDHHKTAAEDLDGFQSARSYEPDDLIKAAEFDATYPIRVNFDMNRSGAGMAWGRLERPFDRPRGKAVAARSNPLDT